MSFREKQKTELFIEVFNKIAMFFYALVVVEVVMFVCNITIFELNLRSIEIEKFAIYTLVTALVGFVFQSVSNKVKADFIKKLKKSN
jgi:hypothetical protein